MDDIAQTALARVFDKLSHVRDKSRFLAWVDRVTINSIAQHYRRKPIYYLFPSSELDSTSCSPHSNPERQAQDTS